MTVANQGFHIKIDESAEKINKNNKVVLWTVSKLPVNNLITSNLQSQKGATHLMHAIQYM